MDGVHVMYERLHGLMYACHRTVHGMLYQTLVALEIVERFV